MCDITESVYAVDYSYVGEHFLPKMTTVPVTAADLSVDVNDPKLLELAAARWMEYGCFVVRGLNLEYCADIAAQVR